MPNSLRTQVKEPTTQNEAILQSTQPYKGHIVTFTVSLDPNVNSSSGWLRQKVATVDATGGAMAFLNSKEPVDVVTVRWDGTGTRMTSVSFT